MEGRPVFRGVLAFLLSGNFSFAALRVFPAFFALAFPLDAGVSFGADSARGDSTSFFCTLTSAVCSSAIFGCRLLVVPTQMTPVVVIFPQLHAPKSHLTFVIQKRIL